MRAGEESKGRDTLNAIHDWLIASKFERGDVLLAFGGGVVGDVAGFAAATYLRGIPCVQCPTTLLAQVDSSIGGKVGVNHPSGKNLIGAFANPLAVLSDLSLLSTLDVREVACGWAEVLKYGLALDSCLWEDCELTGSLMADARWLRRVVGRSVALKAAVTGRDEREGGERVVLNFGHTIGHAIEGALGYGVWSHGAAVAAGMMVALYLSARVCGFPAAEVDRARRTIAAFGLPVTLPSVSDDALLAAMGADKKRVGGKQRWVLLDAIGHARHGVEASDGDVRAALAEARQA